MEDIIIFGRGKYYKKKQNELLHKYRVVAFLDNAVSLKEVEVDESGVEAIHPDNVKQLPNVPILLMSLKWMEMGQQLIALGIEESRIVFGLMEKPYYDDNERILAELSGRIFVEEYQIFLQYKENKVAISSENEYRKAMVSMFREADPYIGLISHMPLRPVSRNFGCERGKAVDRYYIELFLRKYQDYIHGDVMEIADNTYTYMFGKEIIHAYALHVNGWGKNVIKGNLATGEGLTEKSIDCLICTQTVQMIYDIHAVVRNIYKILKPGGMALVTSSVISELSMGDYHNWGEYWRFTDKAFQLLFEECFDKDKIEVKAYGNVKSAMAILYGLCIEDLVEDDFVYYDEKYPVIVTAAVRR